MHLAKRGYGARLVHWLDERRWRTPLLLFLAMMAELLWLTVFRRFANIDELGYKAPGLALVTRGTFETTLTHGMDASIAFTSGHGGWFAVYPLLFAGWIKTWGFSELSSILFDGVIHGALALVLYLIARSLFRELPRAFSLAPALVILLLGTLGRADDLGCLFGSLGLCALLRLRSTAGLALAGCAFALGALTHPQSAIIMSPLYVATLWCVEENAGWSRAVRFGLFAAGAFLLGILPAYLAHPEVLRELTTNAPHYVGNRQHSVSAFAFAWRFGKFHMLMTLLLATSGLTDGALLRSQPRRWCQLWAGPIASVFLILVLMPGRHFYYWFPTPWLVVVAAGRLAERSRSPQRATSRASLFAQLALAGAGVVVGLVPVLQSGAILATLASDQKFDANARAARDLVPAGTRVVTTELWPALAADHEVYHPVFSKLSDADVDYVILTGNGSGVPGEPTGWPDGDFDRAAFEKIHDNLNRSRTSILGFTISRSAYGFGTMIYRRRGLAERSASSAATIERGAALPAIAR